MTSQVLRLDEVRALAHAALAGSGAGPSAADPVADSMREAEAEGLRNHGLGYLPVYCRHLRIGKVVGDAVPQVSRPAPALVRVDAGHGFAHPAFAVALDAFVATADEQGTATLAITRSYSAGALDWFLRRVAVRGLVVLGFANAGPLMPAWGGRLRRFGTNPLGFAAPRAGGAPIVLDMATSTAARVNVMAAARRGETLPEGWALDADGRPTTDPEAALQGMVAPLGGAKGSGLALMVEVLAAALTGAHFSYEASGLLDDEGGPPGIGQLFVAFSTSHGGAANVAERIEQLATTLTSEPGVALPGDRREAHRLIAEREGVEVPDDLLAQVRGFCEPA